MVEIATDVERGLVAGTPEECPHGSIHPDTSGLPVRCAVGFYSDTMEMLGVVVPARRPKVEPPDV